MKEIKDIPLQVRVPEDVRKRVKVLCAYNRSTIKDYITDLILKDLDKNKDTLDNILK